MGLVQPRADLAEKVNRPARRQRAGLADQVSQAEPFEVFHHVVERAVVGATVVVDLDRIRVGEPRRRLHLPLEPGRGRRVGGRAGLDHLQRAGRFRS